MFCSFLRRTFTIASTQPLHVTISINEDNVTSMHVARGDEPSAPLLKPKCVLRVMRGAFIELMEGEETLHRAVMTGTFKVEEVCNTFPYLILSSTPVWQGVGNLKLFAQAFDFEPHVNVLEEVEKILEDIEEEEDNADDASDSEEEGAKKGVLAQTDDAEEKELLEKIEKQQEDEGASGEGEGGMVIDISEAKDDETEQLIEEERDKDFVDNEETEDSRVLNNDDSGDETGEEAGVVPYRDTDEQTQVEGSDEGFDGKEEVEICFHYLLQSFNAPPEPLKVRTARELVSLTESFYLSLYLYLSMYLSISLSLAIFPPRTTSLSLKHTHTHSVFLTLSKQPHPRNDLLKRPLSSPLCLSVRWSLRGQTILLRSFRSTSVLLSNDGCGQ